MRSLGVTHLHSSSSALCRIVFFLSNPTPRFWLVNYTDYEPGDLSKEIDTRVKQKVAEFAGKDSYEFGKFAAADCDQYIGLDRLLRQIERPNEYISLHLTHNIRLNSPSTGDLSKELDKRIKVRVEEFTGAGEYKFGDISRAVLDRRKDWIKSLLGKEAAENYVFGKLMQPTPLNPPPPPLSFFSSYRVFRGRLTFFLLYSIVSFRGHHQEDVS